MDIQVEVDIALQRLAGNKALYVNLARCFPRDALKMVSDFQNHLAENNRRDAAAVLHTMKGVAATVGAQQLAKSAAEIEAQLLNATLPVNAQIACRDIEYLVSQTIPALDVIVAALLPAPRSSADIEVDRGDLVRMMDELALLLEASNIRALSIFSKIQYKLGAAPSPRLASLAEAINSLDFKSALVCCQLLRAELQ
ncbi:MAG: histidine kinase [Rhodocyclales bacterium]|nr:histidine kinase [Rhodocyclales bacterium]